jgi:hypothetical protein
LIPRGNIASFLKHNDFFSRLILAFRSFKLNRGQKKHNLKLEDNGVMKEKLLMSFIIWIFMVSSTVYSRGIEDILFREKDSFDRNQLETLSDTSTKSVVKTLEIPSNEEGKFIKSSLTDAVTNSINNPSFFHFDLSGDDLKDIIYESNFGAEEKHVIIWINRGDGYYFSSFLSGSLSKVGRYSQSESYYLIIKSGFCCLSELGNVTQVLPVEIGNKIQYTTINNYKYFVGLEVPDSLSFPIEFEIQNEKYKLRLSPKIDNEPDTRSRYFDHADEGLGNIIAEFDSGSKGTAIAQKKGEGNRIWWFVIMDLNSKTSYSLFWDDENSYKMGWMSSRYLRIIQ